MITVIELKSAIDSLLSVVDTTFNTLDCLVLCEGISVLKIMYGAAFILITINLYRRLIAPSVESV